MSAHPPTRPAEAARRSELAVPVEHVVIALIYVVVPGVDVAVAVAVADVHKTVGAWAMSTRRSRTGGSPAAGWHALGVD